MAEQDVNRIEKELACRPDADDGHVEVLSFANISSEAAGIAKIASDLVEKSGISPRNILILLRNDPGRIYSNPIVGALEAVGLDAELPTDPLAALDDDDGRRLVCLLRLLREADHDLAWRELLKLRDNQIGASTLFALFDLAADKLIRYYELLGIVAEDPSEFPTSKSKALANEVHAIRGLLEGLDGVVDEPAAEGLELVFGAASFPDGENREELKALLLGLVEEDPDATLGDIEEALHTARSGFDEEEEEADEDRVRIMTMHSAKGLTADAVIVAACENELVPGWPEDERAEDDERRLLYVSLTRARHFLYLTFARKRTGQQSHRLNSPTKNLTKRTFTVFLRDFIKPTPG